MKNMPPQLAHLLEPLTGWFAAISVLIAWWIKGMADRKRAATEGAVAEHGVSMSVIALLQSEVTRLTERVAALENANQVKDTTIADLVAEKLAITAELAAIKLSHGAELASESLLKMAALAETAVLRSRLAHEAGLVEATLAGAHETGRVADAAERAVGTDKKESRA